MKKVTSNFQKIKRQSGASAVEFAMILFACFLMSGFVSGIIGDDGALDNLEEHERRYIDSISAP